MAVSEFRVGVDGEVTVERTGSLINKFSLADAVTVERDGSGAIIGIKGPDGETIASGGGGGGATNITVVESPTGVAINSSSGTDDSIAIADATNSGVMSPAMVTKLAGVATGATANSADATLLARANHTGTQAISTVTNLQTSLDAKAPLASPTFTGTVAGVTASMVGLGNVTNTSDASKPVSTAQQAALDLKANIASPTFTGTVSGITASMVGLGNVTNTSDANKPVSTAQQTALDLKANLASPTFTGTVGGITKSMVGLSNVDNTSDASKPVSTATQTALNLKQDSLVSGTNIKTVNGTSLVGSGNVSVTTTSAWGSITGTLSSQTDLQTALGTKQDTLVSGTSIKTVNGTSLLGSGNISISGTAAWGSVTGTLSSQTDLQNALDSKEAILVIGTTITTSRSLTSGDVGKIFTVDTSAGAVALTLASGVFSGTTSKRIMFRRSGANALTFVQGSGTTLSNPLSITVANGDLIGLVSSESNVATVVGSDANAARTNVTNSFTAAQASTPVSLTDGATITPNANQTNHRLTIAGTGRTLANPTGGTDGQGLNIRIQQDATGSRTITTYGSKYKFPGGTVPTLTTAANAVDYLTCRYDATSDTWMCSLLADIK